MVWTIVPNVEWDNPTNPAYPVGYFEMALIVLLIYALIILSCLYCADRWRTKKKGFSKSKVIRRSKKIEDRLRALDREGYSEPKTSMILYSFCKAKNESRAPKCWNCGAKM